MVSIICTSYNYEKYIAQALQSFVNQKTNFDYEIIVVDDCSTDNSRSIIEAFRTNFPDKVRVFLNNENKGITKTWISICQEARGKYIARCDADDYWIDKFKLQKQVDLLESHPNSKWCNTNFNIVDEENHVIAEQVFTNGPIKFADTYEKLLATKGMTLPSSWLVESDLMRVVNSEIPDRSIDDTFAIQAELFQRTDLSYLDEVTVAYRMTGNSDSRPKSSKAMERRINGLLETQQYYINKYTNRDMKKMVEIQAEHDAWQELRIFHFNEHIKHLTNRISELEKQLQEVVIISGDQINQLKEQNRVINEKYNSVINSRRWIIPTKIIDFFRRNS